MMHTYSNGGGDRTPARYPQLVITCWYFWSGPPRGWPAFLPHHPLLKGAFQTRGSCRFAKNRALARASREVLVRATPGKRSACYRIADTIDFPEICWINHTSWSMLPLTRRELPLESPPLHRCEQVFCCLAKSLGMFQK